MADGVGLAVRKAEQTRLRGQDAAIASVTVVGDAKPSAGAGGAFTLCAGAAAAGSHHATGCEKAVMAT